MKNNFEYKPNPRKYLDEYNRVDAMFLFKLFSLVTFVAALAISFVNYQINQVIHY